MSYAIECRKDFISLEAFIGILVKNIFFQGKHLEDEIERSDCSGEKYILKRRHDDID